MLYQMIHSKKILWFIFGFVVLCACSSEEITEEPEIIDVIEDNNSDDYAQIDFTNWKVTLPVDANNNGSPDEYQPVDLVNGGYRTLEAVKPYMYDDQTDKSIVFYTFPRQSTANSSYSRTELRELILPSNSRVNWSLETGGTMVGRLKMLDISKDNISSREYHRTIVMQIHGILSIADVAKLNASSNNGPPLIKIYWEDGYIWAFKKSLVDITTSGDDLLDTSRDTWVDEKRNMGYVGFDAFNFRITASTGKLELQLNNDSPVIYQDISMAKWPFENYFKAGNYLNTTDAGAFARVKYFSLSVTH